MLYEPGVGLDVTTNDAEAIVPVPPVMVQVDEAIRVAGPDDEIVQVVSSEPKPVPVTMTVVPAPPAFGVSVIVATAMTGVGRLKDAQAKRADATKNTVIANLERRILNSKHAFLWRLALFHDI